MEYQKPEITLLADAAAAIQGTKGIGMVDNVDPQSPLHSIAAYQSDE